MSSRHPSSLTADGGLKHHAASWQPWEMMPIAPSSPANHKHAAQCDTFSKPPAAVEPVALMDESALAQIRLDAQTAGERQGYQEGFTRGHSEGYAAAMAATREVTSRLQALTQSWPAALQLADRQLAGEMLGLTLDLARQVVKQALTVDPQAILAVVHELLQTEPVLTGSPQLFLHPDDAMLVKEYLHDDLHAANWRIRIDPQLARGGCRVQAHSGERDASLETRWERVTAALSNHMTAVQGP